MEFRVSFTVAEHGRLPENGERFMDGFMATFAEGGPSVSQNTQNGTLTVTFSLEANDARVAVKKAIEIFATGAVASGLKATDVLDIEVTAEAADEAETGEHPVLQPA